MCNQRSVPLAPEDRLDPPALRVHKVSKDPRVFVVRWDPLEIVEVPDLPVLVDPLVKMVILDVMETLDPKEFKDQRARGDLQASQDFLE